ncbi:MAG: DNA methyltransferase [bacterium]|nr:DNA methyltransferase [bacterium]
MNVSLAFEYGQSRLYKGDCLAWLENRADKSLHGVVTDPPYGLVEYTSDQQRKLRQGRGGVWRIPPSFDGSRRSPVPRFTTLSHRDLRSLESFFYRWGELLRPVLVPGAHVFVASNPLVSHIVARALADSGLERRGEVVRLVQTLRGGDRPKNAHDEFPDVSVMPRSQWEPWLLFRRPIEGRVMDNLRKYKTGGLRRVSSARPFGDVVRSAPTRRAERRLAPHPSLKPQGFLRQIVRAVLPLGAGTVLDPFAGSGSTLAAAEAVGYDSIGIEIDQHYVEVAASAIPALSRLKVDDHRSR